MQATEYPCSLVELLQLWRWCWWWCNWRDWYEAKFASTILTTLNMRLWDRACQAYILPKEELGMLYSSELAHTLFSHVPLLFSRNDRDTSPWPSRRGQHCIGIASTALSNTTTTTSSSLYNTTKPLKSLLWPRPIIIAKLELCICICIFIRICRSSSGCRRDPLWVPIQSRGCWSS